jgi:hypothetical protein
MVIVGTMLPQVANTSRITDDGGYGPGVRACEEIISISGEL